MTTWREVWYDDVEKGLYDDLEKGLYGTLGKKNACMTTWRKADGENRV